MTDPRILRTREKLHRAAIEELVDRGWGGFRMDGVARRAGVSRSTLYRHHDDQRSLLLAALAATTRQPATVDEEDPTQRIRSLLRHLATAMRSTPGDLLPALVEGASADPDLAARHHAFNDERRAALTAAIDAGPWDVDADLAATALAGAVVYRRLMTATPMSDDEADRLVTVVLGAAA